MVWARGYPNSLFIFHGPPPPQVNCQSVDSSMNPTKGKTSYDDAQHRAEFTPFNTLFPNSKYLVTLYGRAVTTKQCSNPVNIKNTDFHFTTCNPAPKTISVKLRGHSSEVGGAYVCHYIILYGWGGGAYVCHYIILYGWGVELMCAITSSRMGGWVLW